jgi:CHAT domain-containing protein
VWARTALDALERWRTTQGARADRLGALGANGDVADPDVGFASVAAVLARDGRLDAAFELAERLAARELLDALLRRDALRIEPSDRPRTRPATGVATVARGTAPAPIALRELQGMLSDSAAIVEFVTGAWGEATTGIVVTRQRRQAVGLAAADSLIGPINRFRSSVQAGNWPRPLARSLGDALLAPIAAVLPPEVTRIVIVGGTLLQAVPFDALELPDGRAAIERFEISYAPSASVAALLMRRPAHTGNGGVLALGASARPRGTARAAWDSLPELPGAAREARRIAGFFGLADTRVGAQATEAAIKSVGGQRASVVHIAAHAVVDPSAMGETALLLAPGGGEDGILRPEEIGAMTLAADIVVLSACRTTRIDVSYGDEGFRGLVTPLFEAGARSVVATAWPVDDAKQIALADRFYRGLADGQPAGAALRSAKLAAFHAGVAPRDWASVVLWGDPAARPAGRMRKPLLPLAVFSLAGRDD